MPTGLRERNYSIMTTPGTPPPVVTPPPVDNQPPPQEPQTFDQAAVDRIVSERIARERSKFADYNDLKAKATKFDEIEAQNATELDKAVKKADAEARADMSTKTNTRLVRAEVKAAASAAKFFDPADAAVLLSDKFKDVKVTEDGDVDEDAVKALVEQLAKAKPHLVKTDNGRPPPLPGQGQHQQPPSTGAAQGKAEALKRFGPKTS
jgi:hypothetical protein